MWDGLTNQPSDATDGRTDEAGCRVTKRAIKNNESADGHEKFSRGTPCNIPCCARCTSRMIDRRQEYDLPLGLYEVNRPYGVEV